MNTPRRTPALKSGDTIGIVAVSAPCERTRFEGGVRSLEAAGFKVRVALEPWASYGSTAHLYSSDSAAARAGAFHQFLCDPEIRAIIAARGAYGSMEMLPLLDLNIWQSHPKPLVGLSDVTALLLAGTGRAGVVTIHGPTLESAYAKIAQQLEPLVDFRASATEVEQILRGGIPAPRPVRPFSARGLERGVEGRLIGGNLTMIVSLLATRWEPDFTDQIVFLEDCNEKPFRVHRMLLQLLLAGKFERTAAVIIGDMVNCDVDTERAKTSPTLEQVLRDIARQLPCPMVKASHMGHAPKNLSLPLGIRSRVTANHLEFLESAVLQ